MKKQEVRDKNLDTFVNKHLKLSNKLAESLKDKTIIAATPLIERKEKTEVKAHIVDSNQEMLNNPMKLMAEEEATENDRGFVITVESHEDNTYTFISATNPSKEQSENLAKKVMVELTGQEKAKIPFLLKGVLRPYQIIGLDWLTTLHDRKLNGILADEMGLGKTIQTISMIANLAAERGVWGPHLIVVPTTIIMNWQQEFKRFAPAFKILTYFGSQKERKLKRTGWSKDNSFHVCITSYKLVIQDHFAFRRKKWYYMVLDEA